MTRVALSASPHRFPDESHRGPEQGATVGPSPAGRAPRPTGTAPVSRPSTASSPSTPRRKNLTSAEAADYLNVSMRTLRNWLEQGIITGHRLGPHLLRFDADELDAARNHL
ncbi:helix-turn-helix domain-containing protein [Mycobacterium neumannii]|uniref:helix-turn-helix domain-containing protein n=1 Tax=Mycobacterium neumannii TaxID=2048551 RepID=UPI000B93A916